MYSRLLKPPDNSFFLLGPRGTGKSTWVGQKFPNGLVIDLLESEIFNDLLASPGRLEAMVPRGFHDWILIDEVQKIPAILDEVHRLMEKRCLKFVLTGSSARKLKREKANLLAGRAWNLSMHPLTATELGPDFRLNRSLECGHLPSAQLPSNPAAFLEAYVKLYLQEEIQQEGLTRNLATFSRFLEAASFSQGSLLNISEVARDCAVERKTVESYFQILEDILLAFRLPVFTKRARRRMTAHPKFYLFDTGVYRTVRPRGPLDRPEEIDGAALETLVLQEI
ncbi:MAG: AAA family ATPase, partial [bacterium]